MNGLKNVAFKLLINKHSTNVLRAFQEYSTNVQRPFLECSKSIPRTFLELFLVRY